MASIFTRTNEYVQPVKRNTFDLSFQNNLTMQFGKLYPVFVQEVLPGDSFKIKPTFALEFMPMVFPVQTRMRANLHFFYVRNRNLWKDFPDFIANTKEVQPPFLDMNGRYDDFLSVGGLGDYLGIPVNFYGSYGNTLGLNETNYYCSLFSDVSGSGSTYIYVNSRQALIDHISKTSTNGKLIYDYEDINQLVNGRNLIGFSANNIGMLWNRDDYANGFYLDFDLKIDSSVDPFNETEMRNLAENLVIKFSIGVQVSSSVYNSITYLLYNGVNHVDYSFYYTLDLVNRTVRVHVVFNKSIASTFDQKFGTSPSLLLYVAAFSANPLPHNEVWSNPNSIQYGEDSSGSFISWLEGKFTFSSITNVVEPITPENSPYYDSVANPNGIKISALVPRGIETIYNAFYRDIRNNPFMIDGQPEYNKYLETQDGGVDTTPYKLHYRNWEQDFLTTAVQSPQQGAAPLVGISSNGQLKFQSEDGEVFTAQAKFADDGETLTGFTVESPNMPAGNLRALVDMASSGISINDLRNVNSLQRWLENNMRKGLRLKDQIKAHFNVDIRYDELDMPEFIGGCSETIDVRMVTQTSADVEDSPLGSYAGQATCVGTSNHNISHYCDEHGFIIGIFSVAPVPNYSQLLPKHFIKRNVLDYFFPEFGHIGYQPIRYNEVCPVQTFNAGDSLEDTFGYQRAWYDYLARTDEVHGLFRSTLRNYLMNRTFNVKPQLSESFLLVDPNQLNDVFATNIVDEHTGEVKDDKILGQIYFDIKAKRPIPMFGIPRLE